MFSHDIFFHINSTGKHQEATITFSPSSHYNSLLTQQLILEEK